MTAPRCPACYRARGRRCWPWCPGRAPAVVAVGTAYLVEVARLEADRRRRAN